MTKALVQEKIISLEVELNLLKSALTERPDFALDEVNWRKVKAVAKRERKKFGARCMGKPCIFLDFSTEGAKNL